jgi:hypothetical protein
MPRGDDILPDPAAEPQDRKLNVSKQRADWGNRY